MKHTACAVLRGLSPVASRVRCRRAYRRRCSPAVVEVPLAGVLLAAILRLGLRVNLFPSAQRGLYRAVTGTPHSGSLDGGLRESGGCCSQACPWQSRAGAGRGCQARFYQPRSLTPPALGATFGPLFQPSPARLLGGSGMKCPRCQHENRFGAKFCEECAAPLARTCSNCGSQLSAIAKFCPECAHPVAGAAPQPRFASPGPYTPKHLAEKILTSRTALEGERKQVTVLFADVKGSMELLADRDPEEARKLLDPLLERMMEAVHRYEGTVNQVMGDGIMALFGAPLAHEDHAVRACYAALRMQDLVRRYSDELRRAQGVEVQIRVGVNSGEVVVRSIGSDLRMDYTAVGQTTHLAARMEQLAAPGSIRLTAETLHLAEGFVQVTPLGPVPIKGLGEPIEVFELVGAGAARTRLEAAARRGLTRFVGRTAELEQLSGALDRARLGHGQVVAVVGEPGVGKSRLFWELTHSHRLDGWLILQSASVSYGKTTAYLPVLELLRR